MTGFSRTCVHLFMITSLFLWSQSSSAYNLQESYLHCNGTYRSWGTGDCDSSACSYTDEPIYRLCATYYTPDEASAIASALWGWVRHYVSTIRLYWNTGYCSQKSVSSWYDDGDEVSQFNVQEMEGSLIGLEGTDYYFACYYPLSQVVIASDIKLDDDRPIIAQDHISECLANTCSLELVMQHEVGHSYQLDHFQSWPAIMHEVECFHSCNVGREYRSEPLADDMQGLLRLHGRNWTSKKNLGGMPFYNDNGVYRVASGFNVNCGDTYGINFTYMNYYQALGNYNFKMRLALVPSIITGPIDSSVTWWGSTVNWSAGHSGATYGVALNATVPTTALSDNVVYRFWIRIDPSNDNVEIDEGDNWIPTDYLVVGESPANCS